MKGSDPTWQALKYMIISTLSFTVMNSLIKYLSDFNAFQVVFFRCIGSLAICIVYLKYHKIDMMGNARTLMVGRGVVGVISMVMFFASLRLLPFGTAVSLRYLAPIFAAIFAVFFLHERLRKIQWLFFLISFSGVVMIKGFDLRVSTLGLLLIMGAALFSGSVYVFLRAIGNRDHPVVVVFYFMVIATIVGAIGSVFSWLPPSGGQWLLLLSLGIFGYFGQLYMTKAFQVEVANKVAPMKYLEAVFSILAGWLFFTEGYSWFGILGMFLVIGGMMLNMFAKSKQLKI